MIWIGSCATPVAPSGGPPDREPPVVTGTTPANETTNFDGNEVRFQFDKFVDRNSARQNISIEPNLGLDFEVDFSRRTVIVKFLDPLPENTTIIVQLGTDITDTRNNNMSSSYELAFSTGPEIDDGNVIATLRDPDEGSVNEGERVFLYQSPVDFSEPANYVAQSDTSGEINFSYLREGMYSAIWVDDVNRNRIWDRDREFAQPFHQEEFEVIKGEEVDLGTIFIQRPDTVSPNINGVGLLSETRLRLRLSEPVEWQDNASITIQDSLGEDYSTAFPLYTDIEDPQVVYAQALDPLDEEQRFSVIPQGFTDRAGNPLRSNVDPFSGSAEPDTAALRLIEDNLADGIFNDESVEITFSRFIDDDSITDSLLVFEGDQMIEDWEFVDVERNILSINPDIIWQSGVSYEFRVWDPYVRDYATFRPDIWQPNQLGAIEFTAADGLPEGENRLRLYDDNRKVDIDTVFTDSLEIDRLPPLSYTARVYRDVNGDGRWNSGSVDPFEAPEPYFMQRDIPVREGFTSEISVEFIPALEAKEDEALEELDIDLDPVEPVNDESDEEIEN